MGPCVFRSRPVADNHPHIPSILPHFGMSIWHTVYIEENYVEVKRNMLSNNVKIPISAYPKYNCWWTGLLSPSFILSQRHCLFPSASQDAVILEWLPFLWQDPFAVVGLSNSSKIAHVELVLLLHSWNKFIYGSYWPPGKWYWQNAVLWGSTSWQ